MNPNPSKIDVAEALHSVESACLNEQIRRKLSAARLQEAAWSRERIVARNYRQSGLPVHDALIFDPATQVLLPTLNYVVPVLTYCDLDIEFQRARDFGKRLGRRLESQRRALWGAAVTAAAGWIAFGVLFFGRTN